MDYVYYSIQAFYAFIKFYLIKQQRYKIYAKFSTIFTFFLLFAANSHCNVVSLLRLVFPQRVGNLSINSGILISHKHISLSNEVLFVKFVVTFQSCILLFFPLALRCPPLADNGTGWQLCEVGGSTAHNSDNHRRLKDTTQFGLSLKPLFRQTTCYLWCFSVVHCFGSPIFRSIAFAFSSLSGNRIVSSNLFNELSIRTIGIFLSFISVNTFISNYFYRLFFFFFSPKNLHIQCFF